MRRDRRILFAVLLLCLFAGGTARGAEAVRLRADVWMPYNGDPASDLPGYAIEIGRAILARHDATLDYQTMPWSDALQAARRGEIDCVVGANQEEAEGLVVPQLSVGLPRVGLYVRKVNPWSYENVATLRAVRLGVIAGYSYWPALDAYLAKAPPARVTVYNGDHPLEDGLRQLEQGAIDVLAETSSVFTWTTKQEHYPATAFRLVYLHEGDPVYFCFRPGDAGVRLARWFDEGLHELRRSGELARILARYGLHDWQ